MGIESVMINLFAFIALVYAGLIAAYTWGWYSLTEEKLKDEKDYTFISIVVPVRNEEDKLGDCLKDLINQDYPAQFFEIIVADDHSEDSSSEIVKNLIDDQDKIGIRLISAAGTSEQGKKFALRRGIKMASGKLIATTDADCRTGRHWLRTINSYYLKHKPKMISAPVAMYRENTWFKQLQSLEFLSLIASGAGSVAIYAPIMCNAANLIFEKKAFEEVDQVRKDMNYASGDDIFLMLSIRKKFGKFAVRFLKNRNAIVFTLPEADFVSFFSQRMRWISKASGYSSLPIIFSSLGVYLLNYAVFAGFILSIFFPVLFTKTLLLLGLKVLVDLPLLYGISDFTGKRQLMWHYPLLQFLYILYVSLMVPLAFLVRFKWKGRRV